VRSAFEDVGSEEGDHPSHNQASEEPGVKVEYAAYGEDAAVEKDDAKFDETDGEDGDDEGDPHVLQNVSISMCIVREGGHTSTFSRS
jgi:hypothetical protein